MLQSDVHVCECTHCQQETDHPDQELHRQMNLLLSRLDEQQRRWYVEVESYRMGVEIGCSRKLRAWMKRPSSVDGKNSLVRWLSDQSSGFDCQAEVGHAQKKRPGARKHLGGIGAARNGG